MTLRNWLLPRTMRGQLVALLAIVLVPALLVQLAVYTAWYRTRSEAEIEANVELARSVASLFSAFVQDVSRQELILGMALSGLKPETAEGGQDLLRANADEHPLVDIFRWATPQGEIIASSDARDIGVRIGDRPYFQQIREGSLWVVSDLLEDRVNGNPTFVVARGIRDTSEQIRGVVLATIDLSELSSVFASIVRSDGGAFTLFDRLGNLVFIQPRPTDSIERNWLQADPLLASALAGNETRGAFVSPADNVERFAGRVPVTGIGWVAGASRPVRLTLDPLFRSLFEIVILALLVTALSILLFLAIYRRISASLQLLEEHASAVGKGELDHRVEIRGALEFDTVAEALNEMAADLKSAHDATREANLILEQRVAERTAELKKTIEALGAERQRFNDVLDVLPAYVVLLSPDYHVPFANRFFRERFGESHGRRCFEYLFERGEPCEVCDSYKVLKTVAPHQWEWTGPDSRNYDIHDFLFTDTDGSTLILEMGIDITERKQAEAELEKHRHHLEDLVKERTRQLQAANVQLQAEIAERKRAEESLAKERANLQAVFDIVNVGMLLIDEGGVVRRVNNTLSRWVGRDLSTYAGYQPGDLVGCIHALADPSGCGRTSRCNSCVIRNAFESAFRSGQPVHNVDTEATFSVDGSEVSLWLEVSADPMVLDGTRHVILAMNNVTARKKAEQEASVLARFPEENPSPVLRISSNHTLLYCNRAGAPLLESWNCRIGDKVPLEIQQALDTALSAGKVSELEVVASDRIFEVILAPILEFGYVNAYGRDITERRQAQAALAEANALLERRVEERTEELRRTSLYARSLIEASLDPLVTINPEGKITDVNRATEFTTGVPRSELIGSDFADYFTEPDKAREGYQRVLDEGQVTNYPLTIRPRSGKTVDVLYNATVYRNEAREVQGVFAAARDITQRKVVEDALRCSEARLAEAQRIAHLGSWDWDIVTNELSWSDEVFRIFGFAPHEFAPDYPRFLERIHPEDRACVEESVRQALKKAKAYSIDHRIILPDNEVRVVHEQGEVSFNEGGIAVNMLGTVMDITEQVRAQEEAKLRQQQLVQADKMVSLGILVSGVAHEINNPNHSIMSNVTALAEVWQSVQPILDRYYHEDFGDFVLGGYEYSESRDKLPEMFANALTNSKRIQVIVDELRDFARYSPTEKMAAVDANAVVESAVLLLSNMIRKSTDRFSVSHGVDLPPVLGNRQRIEQVVINLLQNASRSLPSRDKGIFVSTYFSPESNAVLIEVRDEGKGIPEEDLKHLGDPFFTTNRASGGMGLGLWVSFNIVHEHGGTLTFFSKEGEGTRAVLSLPVSQGPDVPSRGAFAREEEE